MKAEPRYTNEELGIFKVFFKDNDALLMVIRKFLLGGALTEDEKKIYVTFKENKELPPDAWSLARLRNDKPTKD